MFAYSERERNYLKTFGLMGAGALVLAAIGLSAPSANAAPTFSQTYSCDAGAQVDLAIPAGVTDFTATIAGAAGIGYAPAGGGFGGSLIVNIPAAVVAGQSLHLVAGCFAQGSLTHPGSISQAGGGGSYLALDDSFLAVAGGGGGVGNYTDDVGIFTLNGGSGGASGAGTIGQFVVEVAPGAPGTPFGPGARGGGSASGSFAASDGTAAKVSGGIITPGLGGYAGHTGGAGGGGYTGGGGGGSASSFDVVTSMLIIDHGTGGGGSGYIADSSWVVGQGLNTQEEGSITISYTFDPTVTFDTGSVAPTVAVPPVTVADGTPVSEPSPPTANDWTFTDWFTDAALTTPYDFASPVTENITLYAGWIAVTPPDEGTGDGPVAPPKPGRVDPPSAVSTAAAGKQ